MNDIDLSSYSNWNPIGDFDTDIGFTGTLDGNGYVVKNLTINRPTEDGVGLFAIIGDVNTKSGGKVKNLGLENVNVEGNSTVGGLAGGTLGNIDNCCVIGDISGKASIGGLVGNNAGGTISNSFASGSVTGTTDTGGLVGNNHTGGTISNSYASGSVTGTTGTGGLVGLNDSGTITNSYASSEVTGNGERVGGLIGYNVGAVVTSSHASGKVIGNGEGTGGLIGYIVYGGVVNSYATSEVTGNGNITGGLIGYLAEGTISSSYATGLVQGTTEVGGLVGHSERNAKIENSIWNTQTTGQNAAYGSDDGTGTFNNNKGLTTSEMQDPSNWSGWDSNIWDFSSYPPTLKNMPKSSSSSNPDIPGGGDVPIPGAVRLQIGSDSSSTSAIYVDTSFDLGVFDVDFSSADSCAAAIEDIDEVLSRINTKRSEFGAVINRLSSILESQATTIQNFTSAKSTIMDADIANESADFVKNQILQQTSSALLAQSQNLHASIVLSLIG